MYAAGIGVPDDGATVGCADDEFAAARPSRPDLVASRRQPWAPGAVLRLEDTPDHVAVGRATLGAAAAAGAGGTASPPPADRPVSTIP
ncbi:hypothetical protein STENM327S_04717 [Streptomyces tendae]